MIFPTSDSSPQGVARVLPKLRASEGYDPFTLSDNTNNLRNVHANYFTTRTEHRLHSSGFSAGCNVPLATQSLGWPVRECPYAPPATIGWLFYHLRLRHHTTPGHCCSGGHNDSGLCVDRTQIARRARTQKLYLIVLVSIGGPGLVLLAVVTQLVLEMPRWFEPSLVIPIAGMIFANSMNTVSLAAERFESEFKRGENTIIARRTALDAALIPQINSLFAVGLVALPGMDGTDSFRRGAK